MEKSSSRRHKAAKIVEAAMLRYVEECIPVDMDIEPHRVLGAMLSDYTAASSSAILEIAYEALVLSGDLDNAKAVHELHT